jgi:glycosyltransferase involved in cell wall biosynthesis
MENLITIVIPCKNESSNIGALLYSLFQQKLIRNTKIIIADAESTDDTISIIKKYSNLLNIEIINGGLPAVGRNNGAKIASTKYLLFIDSDVYFKSNDVLEKAVNAAEKNDYELVSSLILCEDNIRAKILYHICNILIGLSKYESPFCPGMFFLVNREKFNSLGGFNKDVKHCEDYLLSKKISGKKFKQIFKFAYTGSRRIEKIGYVNFILMIINNIKNRNNLDYYKKDINYWTEYEK